MSFEDWIETCEEPIKAPKRALVLDVENTVFIRPDKSKDISPYHPSNRLVSVGWGWVEGTTYTPAAYRFFYHKELDASVDTSVYHQEIQAALDATDVVVAHNAKHDLSWLLECGFKYDGPIYDTMVGEYLLLRGTKSRSLSLEDVSAYRGVFQKRGDLIQQMWDDGIQFDAMPMDVVTEYGEADIRSCAEVYISQLAEYEREDTRGMIPIRDMSMEFCQALTDIERAGNPIDMEALAQVEADLIAEKNKLTERCQEIVYLVMGDRPINLASVEQLSWVIYSRKVKDKKDWAKAFNVGTDDRGKPLRRPKMSPNEFAQNVRSGTEPLKKQKAKQCPDCQGKGMVQLLKKDGSPRAKPNICHPCGRTGLIYEDLAAFAGFKLSPRDPQDVANAGFATDKETLQRLAYVAEERGNSLAQEFLTNMVRLNAVEAYLANFVGGINRGVQSNAILHPKLNQCVTATGRLSSSEPNFQNLPRGGTLPLRKAVVSRWKDQGGEITEADFAGLEFVVAGELANDPVIAQMKADGEDAHKKTASIIHMTTPDKITKDQRQAAKSHCVPLNSEILTRSGWKSYYDVQVGEDVMAYDHTSNLMKWTPLQAKHFYEGRDIVRMGNDYWEVRCTPNHKWYGWRRSKSRGRPSVNVPGFFTTEEMTTEHNIVASAPAVGGSLPVTPRQAAVLAWIWCDGWLKFGPLNESVRQANGKYTKCIARIFQKKPQYVAKLDVLLDGISRKYPAPGGVGVWAYDLSSPFVREAYDAGNLDYYNPDYVSFVLGLSVEAREAFMQACIDAEGHYRLHGEIRVSQNEGPLADAIRLALHMAGKDTRCLIRDEYYANALHHVMLQRKKAHITGARLERSDEGKADVWCPQTEYGTWLMRQDRVITISGNSFAPLYGAAGADLPSHIQRYYQEFPKTYPGVGAWHKALQDEAIRNKKIELIDGRQFAFPNAKRLSSGGASGATQIKNFPVQSTATATIVPISVIRLWKLFKQHKVKSLIINTVHDSIVVDRHPEDDRDFIVGLMAEAMSGVKPELKERFGWEFKLPLDVEIAAGPNWLDKEVVHG